MTEAIIILSEDGVCSKKQIEKAVNYFLASSSYFYNMRNYEKVFFRFIFFFEMDVLEEDTLQSVKSALTLDEDFLVNCGMASTIIKKVQAFNRMMPLVFHKGIAKITIFCKKNEMESLSNMFENTNVEWVSDDNSPAR